MNISPKVYTILGTYARAFIAAMCASYMLGNTSIKALFAAGLSAVLPVVLRWANPVDQFPAPMKSVVKGSAEANAALDPLP
jgi:hypothetical protein